VELVVGLLFAAHKNAAIAAAQTIACLAETKRESGESLLQEVTAAVRVWFSPFSMLTGRGTMRARYCVLWTRRFGCQHTRLGQFDW
jgi:hypothetical protein